MKGLFLDIDSALSTTHSGSAFKQHSQDVKVLPGVPQALEFYYSKKIK